MDILIKQIMSLLKNRSKNVDQYEYIIISENLLTINLKDEQNKKITIDITDFNEDDINTEKWKKFKTNNVNKIIKLNTSTFISVSPSISLDQSDFTSKASRFEPSNSVSLEAPSISPSTSQYSPLPPLIKITHDTTIHKTNINFEPIKKHPIRFTGHLL